MPRAIILLPGVGAQGATPGRRRAGVHERPGERARQRVPVGDLRVPRRARRTTGAPPRAPRPRGSRPPSGRRPAGEPSARGAAAGVDYAAGVMRLGLAVAVAALAVCASAQGRRAAGPGAGVRRPELGRRPHARGARRGRAAGDGEHHEADDRARRARAPLARRRRDRARGRGTGRRVDARPSRGTAVTVRDLLIGTLVPSANDAATALAVAAGGSAAAVRGADEPRRRGELGLAGTHYREPARARRAGPRLDGARHRRARSAPRSASP